MQFTYVQFQYKTYFSIYGIVVHSTTVQYTSLVSMYILSHTMTTADKMLFHIRDNVFICPQSELQPWYPSVDEHRTIFTVSMFLALSRMYSPVVTPSPALSSYMEDLC